VDTDRPDPHVIASVLVARTLADFDPAERGVLLLGFLHAAAAGLTALKGPRAAVAHLDDLADHLSRQVA